MAIFKSWLESVDMFPQAHDLGNFISHAATIFLKAKQHVGEDAVHPKASAHTRALARSLGEMCDLLHVIEAKLEPKILSAELPLGKFDGKPTQSLNKNQYPHKFPTLARVVKTLKTIGSHHLIDKADSLAITAKLDALEKLWNQSATLLYNTSKAR